MRRHSTLITLLLLVLLILTACADEGSPTKAVEKYLKAKVAGQKDKRISLACKEWEMKAELDSSFDSADAELKDVSCKKDGTDGEYTLVTCEGTIQRNYEAEESQEQELPRQTFRAIKEDGEWKMCGTP
jgi:hypothetical protein